MKKSLVLALVLVFALASSAFAAVDFGGEFTSKLELIDGTGDFELANFGITSTLSLDVSASAEDEGFWSFEADITDLDLSDVGFEKYKLALTDDAFDLTFWGLNKELSNKNTKFSLISAPKKATTHAVRLVVPVEELATVTADFRPGDALKAFVDVPFGDNSAGLAFQQDVATEDNTVVGYGEYEFDGIATLSAAAGMTLDQGADAEALAFGLGVEAPVTDEVTVSASYEARQVDFANAGNSKTLKAGVEFEQELLLATADYKAVAATYDGDMDDTSIELSLAYRFNTTVSDWDDLFDIEEDVWFTADAPAFKLAATLVDGENYDATLFATAPLLADVAWGFVSAQYVVDEDVEDNAVILDANAYVQATDKLVLKPHFGYETLTSKLTVENTAEYSFGADTTLSLLLGQVTEEDQDDIKKASLSVTVEF